MKKLFAVLVILFLASFCQAEWKFWDSGAGPGDPNYSNSANWSGDTLPVAGDDLYFDNQLYARIDSDPNISLGQVVISDWRAGSIVEVTANGILECAFGAGKRLDIGNVGPSEFGASDGHLIINGGEVYVGTDVLVGSEAPQPGNGGDGKLTVDNGGYLEIQSPAGGLYVPFGANSYGEVQLIDGEIQATNLFMEHGSNSVGWLNILGGTLVLHGDHTGESQWTDGTVTAYNGAGDLDVEYVLAYNDTFITAIKTPRAYNPDPVDGDGSVFFENVLLQWESYGEAGTTFDVYFSDVDPNGGPALPRVAQDLSDTFYMIPYTLNPEITYYWKIEATEDGSNYYSSNTWSFTTSGPKAINPNPADEAVDVDDDVILSWTGVETPDSYDVYFGTDEVAVGAADNLSPEFEGNQSGTTFDPDAEYSEVYYWRVDQIKGAEVQTGDVWMFSTIVPECYIGPFDGDVTGPEGSPDCVVDIYDLAKMASNWTFCGWSELDMCP